MYCTLQGGLIFNISALMPVIDEDYISEININAQYLEFRFYFYSHWDISRDNALVHQQQFVKC